MSWPRMGTFRLDAFQILITFNWPWQEYWVVAQMNDLAVLTLENEA